ncbi:probable disease resistance protein At4g27220 [Trifolium pratense]|uniref:probable disease resistance protein At4g27220 n=1 Tax=Trifolium pratense TaxID=57577 RepID=UPI001E6982AE|nr:probable disease resistance protein At4g27220 [Trifolium pratense]XP_045821578.1 probable disease resistance protein At4g27220 [Trifolium pratense]XP_045821579.1 probable disease resistance protein At4g27220 [Trifolium pratense]
MTMFRILKIKLMHFLGTKKLKSSFKKTTKQNKNVFFGFCCHRIWQYRRRKELAKKEKIGKLLDTQMGLAPAHLPYVELYSSQHFIPFQSRASIYEELFDALNDDNNYIVGLQGMRGIGKTTLVKEVGNKLEQSKQFTQVVYTTVSFSPNIKKIQDDIAGPLRLNFDDCNESDRPRKLRSRLTNGDKILLILDDVWGDIDFNDIGIPHIDNHNGCRILVTSRSLSVCQKLGCSKTVQLDLLSEEDAWIMFQRHAGLSEISTKYLLDQGRKIANECQGLPIAIVVVASSLKGVQRREEWDVALNSLKALNFVHLIGVSPYKYIRFSYDQLKNEKVKRLFLLCSVFRENEEIPIERLTRLCIGAGLFGEVDGSYEDARTQVVISKNKLLDSYLLLKVGQSGVKLHDLVHSYAQIFAIKEIQTIKCLLFQGKLKDVFSCKLDGSKLEILIGNVDKNEDYHNMEVPNSFFDNNTSLRVFYLIYDHYPILALSLPQSIQSLKNIRSLLFTHVNLGDISILGKLLSLETLDLKDCKIDELPHGIAKLEKFRLLNLEGCEIERNDPFEVIERCSSLEELYFTGSFNDFCREITFPELQRYCIDEFSRSVNDSSSKYVSIVDKDGVFLSETTLKYCMQTAEVLRIRRNEWGWRNLIPEIVPMDHGMNYIVELSLSCISKLQYLICTDTEYPDFQFPIVFPKLVVLKLDRTENLEELFNGHISLCNLKTIKLQNCPMLVSLFQLFTYQSLVSLEELQIANCKGLENIISDERREEKSREEIDYDESRASILPKLKVLDIEGCPRLKFIIPLLSAQGLPVLETIRIRRCDGLKYIFGQYQDVVLFTSLKQLELSQLPNFIDMFRKYNHPTSLSENGSSSTSNFGSKPQLQLDYSESNSHCLSKCVGSLFPKLEVLDIEGCPLLEYIFPFLFFHDLPVLETIKIRRCDRLKYIFGQYQHVEFSSLRQLELSQLPNFIDIFCKSNHLISFSEKGSSSTSQLDPIKSNIFSWDTTTTTTIPLVDGYYSESNSYCLNIWERVQCLQIPSKILYNIKKMELSHFSIIKSVFIPSIASIMLLETLTIRNCYELKNIIDFGDYDSGSNTLCNVFPKLKELYIEGCPKMEYIFGQYTDDHHDHVKIQLQLPELKCLSHCNLPSLVAMWPKHYRIKFPALEKHEPYKCSQAAIKEDGDGQIATTESVTTQHINGKNLQKTSKINGDQDSQNDNAVMKVSLNIEVQFPKGFPNRTEVRATSKGKQELAVNVSGIEITSVANLPTNSKPLLLNDKTCLVDQQHQLGEIGTATTPSQINNKYGDGQIVVASPPISITKPLTTQDVDVKNRQEISKTNNDQGEPSQIDEKLGDGDDQIAMTSFSIATTETNDQVSCNDDAVKKESSNIAEKSTKEDDKIISKSPVASQFPMVPSKGDPSKT